MPLLIFSPISLSTSGERRPNFSFTLLDHKSGLLGVSATSGDMRVLLEKRNSDPRAAQAVATGRSHAHTSLRDDLERIKAKEFISTREAHLLLGCSDGHIRNLVDKARMGKASHPIPFLDLDGVTVFPLTKLLEWAERPKRKPRGAC